jgi:glycopeptide antibiotics resistance protein
MIPFGLGLPFVTNFSIKKVIILGMFFSITIELSQLLIGLITKIPFRIADINDVIFNTVGVLIGYILFLSIINVFQLIFSNWKTSTNPLVRFISEQPQVNS